MRSVAVRLGGAGKLKHRTLIPIFLQLETLFLSRWLLTDCVTPSVVKKKTSSKLKGGWQGAVSCCLHQRVKKNNTRRNSPFSKKKKSVPDWIEPPNVVQQLFETDCCAPWRICFLTRPTSEKGLYMYKIPKKKNRRQSSYGAIVERVHGGGLKWFFFFWEKKNLFFFRTREEWLLRNKRER